MTISIPFLHFPKQAYVDTSQPTFNKYSAEQ